MKLSSLTIIWILLFLSCNTKTFSYKIEGFVTIDQKHLPAEWYVDTFYIHDDTVSYFNSDSSRVDITPPYVIKKLYSNTTLHTK